LLGSGITSPRESWTIFRPLLQDLRDCGIKRNVVFRILTLDAIHTTLNDSSLRLKNK
jgi:hypothetical protein